MNNEKISIYVPNDVRELLERDAMLFEIFKKDGRTINMNRFLSLLIIGYLDKYEKMIHDKYALIINELEPFNLNIVEKKMVAENILNKLNMDVVTKKKGRIEKRLSLKPTKDTDYLITHIINSIGQSSTISQYFCRMFISYSKEPLYVREQIIFNKNYDLILNACIKKKGIMFTNGRKNEKTHYVFPYKLAVGHEEMFNYFLCCEKNDITGEIETRSYRLNRLNNIKYNSTLKEVPKKLIDKFDLMIKYGPQFSINYEEQICVKFTEEGDKRFIKIYTGRPIYDHILKKDDGFYYYFNCSADQIYLYLKKFDKSEYDIIYPLSLKKRIDDLHTNNYKNLDKIHMETNYE